MALPRSKAAGPRFFYPHFSGLIVQLQWNFQALADFSIA
jgi:hypothetical protein